ncbi:hypothetical protein [Bacillus toyonensis]|uniref:hypothetical protein n=1 Tax=Bacillus toyonensis TaxID=155322 RepID=UPI002E1A7092|nr:hypothetical protein [Bacillus toyonensis]
MFKKFLAFSMLSLTLLTTVSPIVVNADSQVDGAQKMVSSSGFFTEYQKGKKTCWFEGEQKAIYEFANGGKKDGSKDGANGTAPAPSGDAAQTQKEEGVLNSGMFNEIITGFFSQLFKDTVGALIGGSTCAGDSTGLGLMTQAYVFSETVNVTNIAGLMSVTGMIQWLALTLMVFGVLYYSYQILSGQVEIDPFKFGFRYLMTMILVYYAPYFVQDILNINNKIVYALSSVKVPIANGVTASIDAILPMSFVGFVESASSTGGTAATFFTILVLFIVVIFTLVPFIKTIVWWYVRMFKLFIYTAISPLMFATLATDKTEATGHSFIKNLFQEIFSQLFVIIALFATGVFIAQLPILAKTTGIGVVGLGIALYAALNFLHQVPSLATEMIQGNVGGNVDNVYGGFKKFTKQLKDRPLQGLREARQGKKDIKNATTRVGKAAAKKQARSNNFNAVRKTVGSAGMNKNNNKK